MTVTFVKGIAGKLQQTPQQGSQNLQAQSARASIASQHAAPALSDAAITSIRTNRSEAKEKLSPEKAEKLANSIANQVLSDPATASAAHNDFPITSVRDHFTP